jgi:hypothetical protein
MTLKELMNIKPAAKCAMCGGGGILTVQYRWMYLPEVCLCGTCGGSGRARASAETGGVKP